MALTLNRKARFPLRLSSTEVEYEYGKTYREPINCHGVAASGVAAGKSSKLGSRMAWPQVASTGGMTEGAALL